METRKYAGVMVKCKDRILLCKRNNLGSYPGMWSIPGGKLEEGESSQEGAKREFFEETAVDIDNRDIKFIGLIPRHTRDGKKVKGLMYVYLLETDDEIEPDFDNAIDGEEHTAWKYFDMKSINPMEGGEYFHNIAEIVLK